MGEQDRKWWHSDNRLLKSTSRWLLHPRRLTELYIICDSLAGESGGEPWRSLQQRRVLSSVSFKRRKSWLLAASALASSSLGISGPALAANECGALDASGSVTCTSTNNPYPNGITYGATAGLPLNVTLNSNVNVVLTGPGIGVALNNFNSAGSPVLLSANGATINATQTLADQGNRGLYVETCRATPRLRRRAKLMCSATRATTQ